VKSFSDTVTECAPGDCVCTAIMAAALPASGRDELATSDIHVGMKHYTLNAHQALANKLAHMSETRQCDIEWNNYGECCNVMLDTCTFERLRKRMYTRYQLGLHADGYIIQSEQPGLKQQPTAIKAKWSVSKDQSVPPLIVEDKVQLFVNSSGKWSKWVHAHAYRTKNKLTVQGTASSVQHFVLSELPILIQGSATPQDTVINNACTDAIRMSVTGDPQWITAESMTDDASVAAPGNVGDCDIESSPDSPSPFSTPAECNPTPVSRCINRTNTPKRTPRSARPKTTAKKSSPANTRSTYASTLTIAILENKVEALTLEVAGLVGDKESESSEIDGKLKDFKVQLNTTNKLKHTELLDANATMRAQIETLEGTLKTYEGKFTSLQHRYSNLEKKLDQVMKKEVAKSSVTLDNTVTEQEVDKPKSNGNVMSQDTEHRGTDNMMYSVDTSNRFTLPGKQPPAGCPTDSTSNAGSVTDGFVIPVGCRTVVIGTSMVKDIDPKRLGMASYVIALNGAHLTDIHDQVCALPLHNCDGVRNVVPMAGSNDCKYSPSETTEQHMDNLLVAIEKVFKNANIALSSPLPRRGKLENYNSNIAQLNGIWRDLCACHDMGYIDNDAALFDVRGVPRRQLYDGPIHLSRSGSGRLAMSFIKHIRPPRTSRPETSQKRDMHSRVSGYKSDMPSHGQGQHLPRNPPRQHDRAGYRTHSGYNAQQGHPHNDYVRSGERRAQVDRITWEPPAPHLVGRIASSSNAPPPPPPVSNISPNWNVAPPTPGPMTTMPPVMQYGPRPATNAPCNGYMWAQQAVNGGYAHQPAPYMSRGPWYSAPPLGPPSMPNSTPPGHMQPQQLSNPIPPVHITYPPHQEISGYRQR
jgi:hypothetical protein